MNPSEVSALEARINVIGWALCFGVPVIVAAVIWLVLEPQRAGKPTNPEAELFQYLLLAIALIEIPVGIMMKRLTLAGKLKPRYQGAGPATPKTIVQRAYLIGYACMAAGAMYALAAHLVGGNVAWAMVMLIIPPVGYLIIRPKGDEVESAWRQLSS